MWNLLLIAVLTAIATFVGAFLALRMAIRPHKANSDLARVRAAVSLANKQRLQLQLKKPPGPKVEPPLAGAGRKEELPLPGSVSIVVGDALDIKNVFGPYDEQNGGIAIPVAKT